MDSVVLVLENTAMSYGTFGYGPLPYTRDSQTSTIIWGDCIDDLTFIGGQLIFGQKINNSHMNNLVRVPSWMSDIIVALFF